MRWIIIFLITIILSVPALGLTLDEAVSEAEQNNPEILAAKKSWEAIRSSATKVSTWPDPMLELMYEQIPQSGGSLSDSNMKMYGLSQMIPFPGKLTLKRQGKEDAARVSEEKHKAKKREIIARVKSAYYVLFLVNRSIEINQENNGLLGSFARIAEAKYIVGKSTQHDVLKAEVELSLLENELITLEQMKQTAVARLNVLLNKSPKTPVEILEEVRIEELTYSLDELEKQALLNRPELVAIEYALKKSERELTLARMEYLPDFKVRLLQREMRITGLNGWNAGFMMDMPLWFWKQASGVSEAEAGKDEMKALYQNMENMVRFEVQDAFVKADSAERLANLFKTSIVPQAEQALKAATIAYEADKIDFLTLVNSWKTLLDSKLKYFQAVSNLGKSQAELERVVGKEL